MSDLVARLRAENARWQEHCDGWMERIRATDLDMDNSPIETTLLKTIWADAADEIERLRKALLAISSRDEHVNYRAKNYPKPPPDLQAYNDCADIARRALKEET